MKPETKASPGRMRLFWQLMATIFLIIFPVLMIFFNGSRAFRGLAWQMPFELKTSLSDVRQNNEEVTAVGIKPLEFGIYDPEDKFKGSNHFNLEQVYISWIDIDVPALQGKINQIIQDERIPVLTIEPWNGQNSENTLLADITLGKYDLEIDQVLEILSGYSVRLYISWGHEMDQDLSKRYPWSGKDPDLYGSAYRYVHDRMEKVLKNKIKWIWSPVVKTGSERYWPGDDYVDYIGMPIYSYPAWERSYYGHLRSFKSWYEEKYRIVKQFHKPVFIVELGVTGSIDYQTFWLQEAFESFNTLTSIEAVIFFHSKDTRGSWGENFDTPDWRTDPSIIDGLVSWIKK